MCFCLFYFCFLIFSFSTQSNKAFLLDVQTDDLTEVDAAGLEADAVAVPTSTPAPTVASGTTNVPVAGAGGSIPVPVFSFPGSCAAAAGQT